MTKQQFIEKLEIELKHNNILDTPDILEEYEQRFAFKLADGYSEEEISAKLGDPKIIAAQYNSSSIQSKRGKKALTVMGLSISDLFFIILCILLFAWEIVLAALAIASGVSAVCLIANVWQNIFFFIPEMPYRCACIFGIAFLAFTILTLMGTIYFGKFILQLIRSYGRFHKNALARAHDKASLPSVPIHPQFSTIIKRNLRTITLVSAAIFAVSCIVSFIVCATAADAIEFWHIWGWFGYAG